jgi:transcription initiation factor TFIID subunit 7
MDVDSVEPNVILRVPPAIASQLHQMIANKNTNTTSTTAATFSLVPIDERKFAFALHRDGESTVLPAFLMDLPCIVEAQKTFDKSTYYKAADISQVSFVQLTISM